MVWTCVEGMIEIVVLECFVGGPGGLGLLDMLQVSELPGIFAPLWRCLQRWLSETYVSRILLGLPGSCLYHLTCEKMKKWWLIMNMIMWISLCKGQQWCLPTAPRRSLTTLLHWSHQPLGQKDLCTSVEGEARLIYLFQNKTKSWGYTWLHLITFDYIWLPNWVSPHPSVKGSILWTVQVFSGTLGAALSHPADTLKTRLQAGVAWPFMVVWWLFGGLNDGDFYPKWTALVI